MNNFLCSTKDYRGISIISLEGELDSYTAEVLEKEIAKVIESKRYKIIADFEKLNYISSAGLGVFMGFVDEARSNGGDIKFSSLSENIFQVFDVLGFPLLYEFYDTEEDAIQKFLEQKDEDQ